MFVTLATACTSRPPGKSCWPRPAIPCRCCAGPTGCRRVPSQPAGCSATTTATAPDRARLTLAPGETLIFYTDGFTEAVRRTREMFGLDRLPKLGGLAGTCLWKRARGSQAAVERFTRAADLQDDLTLLMLRRV